jgi:hypothetical protein
MMIYHSFLRTALKHLSPEQGLGRGFHLRKGSPICTKNIALAPFLVQL